MRTVTIDILQDEALNLLKDLEALNVIKLHDEQKVVPNNNSRSLSSKYNGVMSKQPREEVDQQLNELRNEWD